MRVWPENLDRRSRPDAGSRPRRLAFWTRDHRRGPYTNPAERRSTSRRQRPLRSSATTVRAVRRNERYFDLVWGPVHLFMLDTDERKPDGATENSIQRCWLEQRACKVLRLLESSSTAPADLGSPTSEQLTLIASCATFRFVNRGGHIVDEYSLANLKHTGHASHLSLHLFDHTTNRRRRHAECRGNHRLSVSTLLKTPRLCAHRALLCSPQQRVATERLRSRWAARLGFIHLSSWFIVAGHRQPLHALDKLVSAQEYLLLEVVVPQIDARTLRYELGILAGSGRSALSFLERVAHTTACCLTTAGTTVARCGLGSCSMLHA